jgi:hypothetical protein
MKRLVALALAAACLVGAPANADPERYHRYWKEAKDYATAGFAEADKAVAVMKTDHVEYCYRIAMTRTELERSTKLFMYAFEQIDADDTLSDAEKAKLEPMIDDYKGIKSISDRYIALQETRCLAGPSYSDTIPSQTYATDDTDEDEWSDEDEDDDSWDEDAWDDHDASEDDNF